MSGSMDVNAELVNAADGNLELIEKQAPAASPWARRPRYEQAVILKEDVASVKFTLNSMDGAPAPGKIYYDVRNESGKLVIQAEVKSGTTESIDMKSFASGLYTLKAYASAKSSSGKEYKDTMTLKVLLVREDDTAMDAPVKNLAVPVTTEVREGGRAELLFGASDGAPVWALAEVFDGKSGLLETRMVRLSGARGRDGSLESLSFDYKKEYPDAIRVQIFYFKDSRACHAILNIIVYILSVNFRFRSLLSRIRRGLLLLIRSLSRRCLVWSALLPCMTRAAKPSGGIIGGHLNCQGPAPVSCMSMPVREV